MRRLQVAIIGFGRLGRACAEAVMADEQLALAGIVRRPESLGEKLPAYLSKIPVVSHARELHSVDAALICVPTEQVVAVAHDLLQHGTPIVECAPLHGDEFRTHQEEINRIADHHNVPAIVGAGWDPGAASLFRAIFGLLIQKGHTETSWHTAASLHHTTAARNIPGVREALSTELRDADGKMRRYVYVELEKGADQAKVLAGIRTDPLFLGEETLVFPVESIRELEETGHGMLLERRSAASAVDHRMLLLEARYSETALSATVMAAAARAIPHARRGVASNLLELPLASLWGDMKGKSGMEWL